MTKHLCIFLGLILLSVCTQIDAYVLVRSDGEIVSQRGNLEVDHRSLEHNGEMLEEYKLTFDRDISKFVVSVNSVSSTNDLGGSEIRLLAFEGNGSKEYTIWLDRGHWLSFMILY